MIENDNFLALKETSSGDANEAWGFPAPTLDPVAVIWSYESKKNMIPTKLKVKHCKWLRSPGLESTLPEAPFS